MEQNMGVTDERLRVGLGAVLGGLSLGILANAVGLPTVLSPLLGLIGVMMLVTGTIGTCPMYSLLGVDTCSVDANTVK
ncbi:MAG: protein of unknown function (DUF2892) [halophilic archaeon J07HX5]|jgi:Protein of unknown function (DUF2892).|nr:MAG: protein of unknown function (DUF2892) [halophilic archaeon J07HX5]